MSIRHSVPVLLIVFSPLFFGGFTTPQADVPDRTVVASCCANNCCCPTGCECCGEFGADQPVNTALGEKHASDEVSFWGSLACSGHVAVLSYSTQDSYMFGLDSPALPNDTLSRKEWLNNPVIKDIFVPPSEKVPRLLS